MKKLAFLVAIAVVGLAIWQRHALFYFAYDGLIVGRSQPWQGTLLEVEAPFFFLSRGTSGPLLIGNRGVAEGLFEVSKSATSLEVARLGMSAGCEPERCSSLSEEAAVVGGRTVVRLARTFKAGGGDVYRVIWWIEGSQTRLKYEGTEQGFAAFAPLAERMLITAA